MVKINLNKLSAAEKYESQRTLAVQGESSHRSIKSNGGVKKYDSETKVKPPKDTQINGILSEVFEKAEETREVSTPVAH